MRDLLAIRELGKTYRHFSGEWKRMANWFGFSFEPVEEIWVLKDISFRVGRGEAVGIIGQNGAGKSTLLKLITGTLRPTTGSIMVQGRVSAILELGMGFNPELSARENVIHAGGLMGFNPDQMRQVMPEIEEFAEVGEYFDQPLRVFSSGMQMRIAFALATAFRPELLVIDEALAVGDTYFQHKSFARIREFRERGTSLLIVSHDRSAIQALCSRAILLEGGRVIKAGDPEEVFDYYNALIAKKENSSVAFNKLRNGKVQTISGSGEARLEGLSLFDSKDNVADTVQVGERLRLHGQIRVHKSLETLVLGFAIKDRLGQIMYGTNTWHTGQVIENPVDGNIYDFSIAFPANFGIGNYSIAVALHDKDTHLTGNYEWQDLAIVFDVVNNDQITFAGCNWMNPEIVITPK